MRRTILILAALIILLTVLTAGGRHPDPDRVYTVQRGDTLWDLAEEFLGSPWLWPLIWQANPELVEHPHWIYPGEEFLVYRDKGRIVVPETRIDVGRLIQNVGVIEVTESTATCLVLGSTTRLEIGDYVDYVRR
ncbi:LysM peptidoglycan-binding domain-containing protein [bacterium]|nr:LysM peptidoglycan-binding domain-containing protein [bacterium]